MLEFRRAVLADEPAIQRLMGLSLGWDVDERLAAIFQWMHHENPFGESPSWVAVDDGEVVGFRTFLRWEFVRGDKVFRAVRAVNTATHPDHQGKGIFSKLTLAALDELWAERVDFVFNTPNTISLPGYLKMGWTIVGRLPIAARPRLRSLHRLVGARVAAERWSVPTEAGLPAADIPSKSIARLLTAHPPSRGLHTNRSPTFIAWRYGIPLLSYRAMVSDEGVEGGVVFFRLRRRGPSVEATVCDVLAPRGLRSSVARRLLRRVTRSTRADYLVMLGDRPPPLAGFVPLPRSGPLMAWRGHNPLEPTPRYWDLCLGDIELF